MDNVAVINVIVADGNAVRRKSIIGRVIEVNSGEDGKVRNVRIRTLSGN